MKTPLILSLAIASFLGCTAPAAVAQDIDLKQRMEQRLPALDDLRLDVPDLATQRRIVAAANLARREAVLAASLVEKSLSLTTLTLADAAKRAAEFRPSERSKS